MAGLGGLFSAQDDQDAGGLPPSKTLTGEEQVPEITDPAAAARVSETLGDVRGASASARQDKATEIAKHKPQLHHIRENADGTSTHTFENVPPGGMDPQTEIHNAEQQPHYDWLHSVVQSLDKGAKSTYGSEMPGGAETEKMLATPAGRRQLLEDTGFKMEWDAHHRDNSLLGVLGSHHDYNKIADNPELAKRIIYERQAKALVGATSESQRVLGEAGQEQRSQRQTAMLELHQEGEQRRESADLETKKQHFIGDFFKDADYGFLNDQQAQTTLEALKQHWKATFQEEMPPEQEKIFNAHIAGARAKNAAAEAYKATQDDHWRMTYERLAQSEADRQLHHTSPWEGQNLSVDDLVSRVGNESYHQPSAVNALPVRDATLASEQRKITTEKNVMFSKAAQLVVARNQRIEAGAKPSDRDAETEKGYRARMREIDKRLGEIKVDRDKIKAARSGGSAAPQAPQSSPSSTPAAAPATQKPKVGDVVPVKGRQVKITKINPNGTFDWVAVSDAKEQIAKTSERLRGAVQR